MTNMIAALVSRASHVHHVPHVGFPQIDPAVIVTPVKITPASADARASRSAASERVQRYPIEAKNTIPNARYATHAVGTWRYMIRWTLPCVTSRGATPNPMTRPPMSPRVASQPSARVKRSSVEDEVERQDADRHVYDVRRGQEPEPVRHGPERLAEQHRLGRLDGAEQDRHLDGEQEDREQQLPRPDLRGHRGEERADRGEPDRAEADDEREAGDRRADVDVKKDREQREENGLDQEHQQQVSGELAKVDGGFVAGREAQAIPAVVLALADERPAETEQPAQDEPEPEQARQHGREPFTVGPERELEEKEEQEREEEERVQRLLGAPLDREVLPHDDPGAAREPHGPSSVCSAYSRASSSGVSVVRGVSSTMRPPARITIRSATFSPRPKLCVAIRIAPPRALKTCRYSSSHFLPCGSRPADGSSSSTTSGRASTTRASDSRRFIPAEKLRTRSSANGSSSTATSASRRSDVPTVAPESTLQKRRFSRAVRSS